jgi:hypothetical protein
MMKNWMSLIVMVAVVGLFSPAFAQDKPERKEKKQDGDKKPPERKDGDKKDGDKDKKDEGCKGLDEKGLLERLIEKMKDKSPDELKKKIHEHMKMHKDGLCHCMCDHKKGEKKDGDKKPPEKKERKEKKDGDDENKDKKEKKDD